jgi:D-tagatose-bisphosphate aldolase class II non-catalytic subunit
MNASNRLREIVAKNRSGQALGVPSWCTAHPQTLGAILRAHCNCDDPILIEATCNQVNQHGGYTGMNPARFRAFVEGLAADAGVDPGRIILGGDHLGPNPWKSGSAREAMAQARDLVRAYIEAGFDKIHLDASMACADDGTLSEAAMAERAAELCAEAEAAKGAKDPVYIIGTEVPIPGGELQMLDALAVTPPEAALRSFALHRSAFAKRGVGAAMQRVIGLVVQPGVDMGNVQVFEFDRKKAEALSAAAHQIPDIVFEAHSTDFQSEAALTALVAAHFAILKVGPSLTFAFREAIVAMAAIEERLAVSNPSDIVRILLAAMDADPVHWRNYIAADPQEGLLKLYGLSDRIRYYWPTRNVAAALKTLTGNIDAANVPPGLLWQFVGPLPPADPGRSLSERIVEAKVGDVVSRYRRSSGLAPARAD